MHLARSAALTFMCALFLAGCTTTGVATTQQLLSRPAPEFSLTSIDGQKVSISELRGKVVVIDFWATWCPPCRESLPHLQTLAADPAMHQAGLVVLAVDEREDAPSVQAFLGQIHFSSTVLLDANGSVERAYAVDTLPTTVVVGRDGRVCSVINGFTSDSTHQLDEAVARALGAPLPPAAIR